MQCLRLFPLASIGLLLAGVSLSSAAEYRIGEPLLRHGMEIAAVYLQPIEMEPPGMMMPAVEADIHLEADIHAAADNGNGFAEGDWLPNLHVEYRLTKVDGGEETAGSFMPMVASDGPHYGDNVKLMGPGKYRLELTIHSQSHDETAHFGRHVDKETGVAPWPEGFSVDYEFTYAGVGKKGGY
ncbi:34 kDa membrane antigen [Ensifer psoraleae]|uniref:iron transporter n=1 Tax=Sinorhizobium psoraleae TaxID=520838 RepID=UPI001568CD14|nr:iron transporter [Sinorhizobium psoraleae]NRP74282.1 34 kDa membrane antigen [Sinorhizobium psoraleae]